MFTRPARRLPARPGRASTRCSAELFARDGRRAATSASSRSICASTAACSPTPTVAAADARTRSALLGAAPQLDWSAVEPSIFGTLFERGLDPGKRAQLGAHYTSREDIETLVEPVVMAPLRREWTSCSARTGRRPTSVRPPTHRGGLRRRHATHRRRPAESRQATAASRNASSILVRNFLDRLAAVTVLDPACGSGNFLYVALRQAPGPREEVCPSPPPRHLGGFFPRVGPRQLHGIEINPYAHELAQMTVWIGYLQWMRAATASTCPPTRSSSRSTTSACMDAILDLADPRAPAGARLARRPISSSATRRSWAASMLRRELGDDVRG